MKVVMMVAIKLKVAMKAAIGFKRTGENESKTVVSFLELRVLPAT